MPVVTAAPVTRTTKPAATAAGTRFRRTSFRARYQPLPPHPRRASIGSPARWCRTSAARALADSYRRGRALFLPPRTKPSHPPPPRPPSIPGPARPPAGAPGPAPPAPAPAGGGGAGRGLPRLAHLDEQPQPLVDRQGVLVAEVRDRLPLHQLHHEVGPPQLGLAGVQHAGDVRVVREGERLPLLFEARHDRLGVHPQL